MVNCKLLTNSFTFSGSESRCYSCTTMDVDKLMREITDPDWQQWLTKVRDVPRTPHCGGDHFDNQARRTSQVPMQSCDDGICMKLLFKERHGKNANIKAGLKS